MEKHRQETLQGGDREIEEHQEKVLKRINESMYAILLRVSREVLGHALGLEDHQDLILKSLANAKKEGFFDTNK